MLDYRTIFKLFYMLDYMLDYTLAILHVRLFYMLSYMLDYRISSNKHWASIKHRPLISAALLKQARPSNSHLPSNKRRTSTYGAY